MANVVFPNARFDETEKEIGFIMSISEGVCQVEATTYGHGDSFRIESNPERFQAAEALRDAQTAPKSEVVSDDVSED